MNSTVVCLVSNVNRSFGGTFIDKTSSGCFSEAGLGVDSEVESFLDSNKNRVFVDVKLTGDDVMSLKFLSLKWGQFVNFVLN